MYEVIYLPNDVIYLLSILLISILLFIDIAGYFNDL